MNVGGSVLSLSEVQFGLQLLARVVARAPGTNRIVSPVGLFHALSLYAFHGTEEVRHAARKALGISGFDDATLRSLYGRLRESLRFAGEETRLTHATTLWTSDRTRLDASFGTLAEEWDIAVHSGDDATAERMETWVREHTGGLLSAEIAAPRTNAACILDAVYFRGIWTTRFDVKDTKDRLFHRSGGMPKVCRLMRQPEMTTAAVYHGARFDAVRLPYASGRERDISLNILLPRRSSMGSCFYCVGGVA